MFSVRKVFFPLVELEWTVCCLQWNWVMMSLYINLCYWCWKLCTPYSYFKNLFRLCDVPTFMDQADGSGRNQKEKDWSLQNYLSAVKGALCPKKGRKKSGERGERGALQYPFIELMKLVRGVRFLCRPFFQCRGKTCRGTGL